MVFLILLLVAILVQTTWVDPRERVRRAAGGAGGLRPALSIMRAALRSPSCWRLAAAAAGRPSSSGATGYAPPADADTAGRGARAAARRSRSGSALPVGAEIGGFLSPRGLPPLPGRFVVTDTGLVFLSADGRLAQTYPLIGPVRMREGRAWRAPMVSLAYTDSALGGPVYVFRVDGGVFGTAAPGPLMDVAARPAGSIA